MDVLQLRKDTTLTEAEKLELLRDPYSESPKYAWITATILCSIIAIFGLANMSYLFRRRYPALFANSWYTRKKTALWRYLAAKQQRVKAGRVFHFPVLGAGLVMLAFFLFMFSKCRQLQSVHCRWSSCCRSTLTLSFLITSMALVCETLLLQSPLCSRPALIYSGRLYGS